MTPLMPKMTIRVLKNTRKLRSIIFTQCMLPNDVKQKGEFCTFSDASDLGYDTVVHSPGSRGDGSYDVKILLKRPRVAPTEPATISLLEFWQ